MLKKIVCYLCGHDWDQLPYEDAPKGWSYERKVCRRCRAYSRMLVAGRLG